MKIETIAELMDCTEGVIINRLNYTRKYMMKALENYQEEKKIKVFYTVEAVCMSLRKWSVDHCLGITVAQNVYAEICKNAGVQPAPIYLEGKEFAGVNNTIVYHKADDFTPLQEQLEEYGKKQGLDKRVIAVVAGIAAVAAIVVLAIVLLAGAGNDKKDNNQNPVKIEEQKEETKREDQDKVKTDAEETKEDPKEERPHKIVLHTPKIIFQSGPLND